jgi:hypothetical protein
MMYYGVWIRLSFDTRSYGEVRIYYGKGERRLETKLLEFNKDYLREVVTNANYWRVTGTVHGTPRAFSTFVTLPKPYLIAEAAATTDSLYSEACTISELASNECRQLYERIAGVNFALNTPDFAQFTDAIERSLNDPNGWCHKRISEKQRANGGTRAATYLRITAGDHVAHSPGHRYVFEIWPRSLLKINNFFFTPHFYTFLNWPISPINFRPLPKI